MITDTKVCRPVRIFLAMEESCLTGAIKNTLPVVQGTGTHVYVDTHEGADLVIFDDIGSIEKGYNPDKAYGYFGSLSRRPQLSKGMVDISSAPVSLLCICELIQKVCQSLKPLEIPVVAEVEVKKETVPLRADAMRILVIDDTPENILSAKRAFAGHHLITATGYEEAMILLRNTKFDIVLTDMQLPMSSKTMGDKFQLGVLVHYGWLLRDEAARQGAKYVGVVTAVSHHDDPISAAVDYHSVVTRIENAKTLLIHARHLADGSKDWAGALKLLMEK